MKDRNYFKVYAGSPLYKAIMNYMRNRNNAAIEYMNKECGSAPQFDIELYKTKLKEFYNNYPPMFNKDVCNEEI